MTAEGDMASFNHRCGPSFPGKTKQYVCEDVLAGTDDVISPLLGSTSVQVDVSVGAPCCWLCGRKGVAACSPPLSLQ